MHHPFQVYESHSPLLFQSKPVNEVIQVEIFYREDLEKKKMDGNVVFIDFPSFQSLWGSVIFYQGGAPENWGDQVLCLRSKGGDQKIFSN